MRSPPNSSMACFACCSSRALPCQPSAFARNDTPWPFTVRATIRVGPFPSSAS